MKKFQVFASAFLGGVLVAVFSLSGLLLREEHPVAASMLFGVMLLAVLLLDLHLMTAKAGYLLWDSEMIRMRAVHLALALCGNAVGAFAAGELLRLAYPCSGFAKAYILSVFDTGVPHVIVGAWVCGMLMFVAVHAYRRARGGISGVLVTLGAGTAIAFCGFEHSLTDMFYTAYGRVYTGRAMAVLLLGIVGNLAGAVVMSLLYEYKKSVDEVNREQQEAEEASERRHAHHHHHSHETEE